MAQNYTLLKHWEMLLVDTTPRTRQCHMSNLTPCYARTRCTFCLCLNDDLDAPALFPFVLRSKQYGSPLRRVKTSITIPDITTVSDM